MMVAKPDFSSYHIGVFDSGLGGRHFTRQLQQELPGIRVTNLDDRKNIPYGRKTPAQLLKLVTPFIMQFESLGVDAIVIACNTCFINLEPALKHITSIPIIGFLPPLADVVKETRNGVIAVCATEGTLRSKHWRNLKACHAANLKILDIDCTDWVPLIEAGQIKSAHLRPVIEQIIKEGADSLILGCTHYHWIKNDILNLLPAGHDLRLYEPTQKVISQLLILLRESVSKNSKQ